MILVFETATCMLKYAWCDYCINYYSTFVMGMQRIFSLLLPKGCCMATLWQSCIPHSCGAFPSKWKAIHFGIMVCKITLTNSEIIFLWRKTVFFMEFNNLLYQILPLHLVILFLHWDIKVMSSEVWGSTFKWGLIPGKLSGNLFFLFHWGRDEHVNVNYTDSWILSKQLSIAKIAWRLMGTSSKFFN